MVYKQKLHPTKINSAVFQGIRLNLWKGCCKINLTTQEQVFHIRTNIHYRTNQFHSHLNVTAKSYTGFGLSFHCFNTGNHSNKALTAFQRCTLTLHTPLKGRKSEPQGKRQFQLDQEFNDILNKLHPRIQTLSQTPSTLTAGYLSNIPSTKR